MQFATVNINDKYEDCELLKFASLFGERTCVFKPFSSLWIHERLLVSEQGEKVRGQDCSLGMIKLSHGKL